MRRDSLPTGRSDEAGFTLIELMIVVAIIGILAAVAIPAFMKYLDKTKTTEARQLVKKVYDGARSYYMDQAHGQNSLVQIARQFPDHIANPSPAADACCASAGEKCAPDATLWTDPSWTALQFTVDDPHYYWYSYNTANVQTTYTARANGNLDCDATFSTFEMYGEVATNSDGPTGSAGIYRERDLE